MSWLYRETFSGGGGGLSPLQPLMMNVEYEFVVMKPIKKKKKKLRRGQERDGIELTYPYT